MIILNTSYDVGSIKIMPKLGKIDKKNHFYKGNALIIAHCCGLGVLIISHCWREEKRKEKIIKNRYE